MTPKTYNFPTQYQGDTINARQLTVTVTSEGVTTPLNLSNIEITMDVRLSYNEKATLKLTESNGITKIDNAAGVFKINEFSLKKGDYVYDLQFKYISQNVIKTYLRGTINVVSDVTRL